MLEASRALLAGHFLLSSGLHSPRYVQCALLLEHPVRARRVGEALAAELRPFGVESVLSPAMGGLIIGHETAAALGVPFRFTERKDGRMELRRGFALRARERVAIVEDVVTTGKSTAETVAVAAERGAVVVAVGAILDRTGGRRPSRCPSRASSRSTSRRGAPTDAPSAAREAPPRSPAAAPRARYRKLLNRFRSSSSTAWRSAGIRPRRGAPSASASGTLSSQSRSEPSITVQRKADSPSSQSGGRPSARVQPAGR